MSQHNVGREDDLDEDDSSQDEERVALSSLMVCSCHFVESQREKKN